MTDAERAALIGEHEGPVPSSWYRQLRQPCPSSPPLVSASPQTESARRTNWRADRPALSHLRQRGSGSRTAAHDLVQLAPTNGSSSVRWLPGIGEVRAGELKRASSIVPNATALSAPPRHRAYRAASASGRREKGTASPGPVRTRSSCPPRSFLAENGGPAVLPDQRAHESSGSLSRHPVSRWL